MKDDGPNNCVTGIYISSHQSTGWLCVLRTFRGYCFHRSKVPPVGKKRDRNLHLPFTRYPPVSAVLVAFDPWPTFTCPLFQMEATKTVGLNVYGNQVASEGKEQKIDARLFDTRGSLSAWE